MKKICALIILSLFLVSLIPSALAEEDVTNIGVVKSRNIATVTTVSSEDTSADQPADVEEVDYNNVKDYIKRKVKDLTNIDECVRKVKHRYPNATRDRVLKLCRNILSLDKPQIIRPIIKVAEDKVKDCVEKLRESHPDVEKEVLVKRCRLRLVSSLKPAKRLIEVKKLKGEDFREHQKERLKIAIEKCREKDLDPELCEKKFEKRVELIKKLKDKDLERLKRIEERKLEKSEKFANLTKRVEFLKFDKNLEFKARAIDKIKLEKARKNFLKAKERFLEARGRYQLAQQKFLQAKLRIKECEGNETDECQQIRKQIKEHAKENLIVIADRILEHLNKLKAKVEANEDLSEEEAAEIIAKIDEQIKAIEDAKATIESSESKEEIIEAAKTLKRTWIKIKVRIKEHIGRTVNARIGGIIVKSKHLELKLGRVLARMVEKGIDTAIVEPLIEEFNAKLEEARTNHETAVEKFKEAKATEIPSKELIKEAQTYLKNAHKALKEAQQILRKIILAIKQAGGEKELEEVEEEEIEEEIEEETIWVQKAIYHAEEKIARAEEKIAEKIAEGFNATIAEDYLAQAKEMLAQAKEKLNAEEYKEARKLAQEARKLAMHAKRGKSFEKIEVEEVEEEVECITDEDCKEGEVCIGGECKEVKEEKEPECVVDADCKEDEVCIEGECEKVEEPECTVDTDCEEDEICVEGKCEKSEE